ncbi:NADH:flavin oxidoreductase/NADH oxidase [Kytococcus sp. Marseille-QA3725]
MPRPVALFEPMTLRDLTVRHRAWVAAMCQYSCDPVTAPGVPNDWHLVHLGAFATGGASMIVTEAAAVNPVGRIAPQDAGIWNDEQVAGWRRVNDFVHGLGTGVTTAVQLAHAGRKASTWRPFDAQGRDGSVPVGADEHGRAESPETAGWQTLAPTDEAFGDLAAPRGMTEEEIRQTITDFGDAAERAVAAGFDAVEVHGAHGYLIHQFISPLVNTRTDAWGGSEEGRHRFGLEVVREVRRRVPESMPVLLRISATDWEDVEGDVASLQRFVVAAAELGVDFVDVSSGGNLPRPRIVTGPGYQVRFATAMRDALRAAGHELPVGAVGEISSPHQAETIVGQGQADVVLLARAALANPHWWMRAATELGAEPVTIGQYERARVDRLA